MHASEAETIIRFDETDGPAEMYTASPRVAGLLVRRGFKPYKSTKCARKENGWFFRVPKGAVLLKPGKVAIRIGGKFKMPSIRRSEQQSCELKGVS